jgi:hypothetical protein
MRVNNERLTGLETCVLMIFYGIIILISLWFSIQDIIKHDLYKNIGLYLSIFASCCWWGLLFVLLHFIKRYLSKVFLLIVALMWAIIGIFGIVFFPFTSSSFFGMMNGGLAIFFINIIILFMFALIKITRQYHLNHSVINKLDRH